MSAGGGHAGRGEAGSSHAGGLWPVRVRLVASGSGSQGTELRGLRAVGGTPSSRHLLA